MDYFGARYYSSPQGRFTSADKPLVGQFEDDPQSWNLYTYAGNNPLIYVDPTGEDYRLYDKDGNILGEVRDAKELDKLGYKYTGSENEGSILHFEGGYRAEYFEGDPGPGVNTTLDRADAFMMAMARRAPAMQQAIDIIANVNLTPILIISGSGIARGGITTLGIGGSRALISGQLILRTIQTSKGPVDVLAEVVIQGDRLWLKDIVVYGRASEPLTGLTSEIRAALSAIRAEARSLGFKELRITGERILSSSSKNPGHTIDIILKLR